MIPRGQKRKFPLDDEDVSDRTSPNWETQRQFVFSVSLSKYQRSQELVEPSLRRSVLIANTLRQVSLEACGLPSAVEEAAAQQQQQQPPFSSSSALQQKQQEGVSTGQYNCVGTVHGNHLGPISYPMPSLNYSSNCAAGTSPACHSSQSNVPMSVEEEDEEWGSMSPDSDLSLSAAIASILSALESTIDGSPQAAPRTPLRSLENLPGSFDGGVSWEKQGVRDQSWEQQDQCRVGDNSAELMRSSYLSDLTMEELLQDIDMSLLERDLGVLRNGGDGYQAGDDFLQFLPPFSPPLASSHPSSLSFNPSLKCLPSFSSFSPSSSSSSSALSLPMSSQNLVRDGFELENLMEILVES
ncbi:SERTA domain-containing protein 3 [Stegastes partitus]|uniref:Cell division cycle-associated protein 4-like n=1 Tax=Stegastes partitus TaxID=144197 RepID=A0A9Y4K9R4_9TELE|nr:PREDICTED: cell division cycle-associated protein 4-like [Stegastes partitus]XP_008289323.1 PREDICTED: cell division cycle-associated protein 4-like [Stegastes partitus]